MPRYDTMTIEISLNADGNAYHYNIFENDEKDLDGGLCTGSMTDAIEMACNDAKNLLKV